MLDLSRSNAFHVACEKFPGSEIKAANGILFLRLLTPIIVIHTQHYGNMNEEP